MFKIHNIMNWLFLLAYITSLFFQAYRDANHTPFLLVLCSCDGHISYKHTLRYQRRSETYFTLSLEFIYHIYIFMSNLVKYTANLKAPFSNLYKIKVVAVSEYSSGGQLNRNLNFFLISSC